MLMTDYYSNDTGIVEWSEYQSKTEAPVFSEPISTNGQIIIFERTFL